jgi:large subunit ribosomal protein L23
MNNNVKDIENLIDLIKYPLITDKATRLLELNQYTFLASRSATKTDIKNAIEYLFNVKVTNVNTSLLPIRKKRLGKFIGSKTRYKKAVVTLDKNNTINLFSEN